MKKISLIMAVVILFSTVLSISVNAVDIETKDLYKRLYNAKAKEINGRLFAYRIVDGKYAEIANSDHANFIPKEINGYPVKKICENAYWDTCYDPDEGYDPSEEKWDVELVIPDTVTRIESNAFHNNPHFKKIIIPDSVSGIEQNTFYSCVHLKDVTFPKGLEYIGKYAFDKCYSLETYDFSSCNWLTLEDKSITNKKAKFIAGPYSPDVKNYATENNIECLFAIGSNSSYAGLCSAGNKLTLYVDREKHTDYSTSTPEIIKLTKNGKLTALKKGTAKFKVTLPSGKIYKGTIKVLDDPVLKKRSQKAKRPLIKRLRLFPLERERL